MSRRHWLISSFEPFATRKVNNSQVVMEEIQTLVKELGSDPAWNFEMHFIILPVLYDGSFEALKAEVERLEKSGVKLEGILGIGEGAEDFKLETQANNLNDVPNYPDNSGTSRVNEKIFSELPKTATLPLRFPKEAFGRIRTSINPGFFVCNNLCAYMAQEWGSKTTGPYAGFIHVPRSGEGGVFTADVCAAMIVNSFKKIV